MIAIGVGYLIAMFVAVVVAALGIAVIEFFTNGFEAETDPAIAPPIYHKDISGQVAQLNQEVKAELSSMLNTPAGDYPIATQNVAEDSQPPKDTQMVRDEEGAGYNPESYKPYSWNEDETY